MGVEALVSKKLRLQAIRHLVGIPPHVIRPSDGHAYYVEGHAAEVTTADPQNDSAASALIVLENGRALGPPHRAHADIVATGGGQFSHWSDGKKSVVYFSSSDNSDPRTNGRVYQIVVLIW